MCNKNDISDNNKAIGNNSIIWIDKTDSTQAVLLSKPLSELREWTVIATREQTRGRGQGENTWESEKNKNLTFSFLLKPRIQPSKQFLLTQIISLGVCDYLSGYIDNIWIKWPNDIYIGKNKIAGILVQNIIQGSSFAFAICGIGLNINQTRFRYAPNPSSLRLETGMEFDLEKELPLLISCISLEYERISNNLEEIKKDYLSRLLYMDRYMPYQYNKEVIRARIIDINDYGHLVLECENSKIITGSMSEIRLIRP